MAISATYVSATSFTVATDLTSDFVPGRAVYCDCDVDGGKLAYVDYSTYSSPDTTVHLDPNESDALTENLTSVLLSRVKPGIDSGNLTSWAVWDMRGKQTIRVSYKDADEVTLSPGIVHIHDGTYERIYRCNGFDKQLTSLSASTWYAIYAKPPTNGLILSASEIEYSSTMPTENTTKQGWYHGTNTTWRCIGFVRVTSSGAIGKYFFDGQKWIFAGQVGLATNLKPSYTWTDVTADIPIANAPVLVLFTVGWAETANTAYWCYPGGTWLQAIAGVSSSATIQVVQLTVLSDSAKNFQVRFSSTTANNYMTISENGFVLPPGILTT